MFWFIGWVMFYVFMASLVFMGLVAANIVKKKKLDLETGQSALWMGVLWPVGLPFIVAVLIIGMLFRVSGVDVQEAMEKAKADSEAKK